MERSLHNGKENENENLKRRVLQSTLEEVAARDEPSTDCCVICLEGISEPCELLPCGHHNFDYLCLISWLYETPLCPLCKASASKVLHGPPDNRKTTPIEPKPKRSQSSPHTATSSYSHIYNGRPRPPFRRRRERPHREHESEGGGLEAIGARRREIYIHKRYSKHVGSNRLSRYQELTPAMFCSDDDLVSRARMFVRRELQVFSFLTLDETGAAIGRAEDSQDRTATERRRANNAEFLLEYIIAILKSVDIMGSAGQAEDMLSDFLGRDNTKLFWHELRAWLRSPYTKLEDWDRAVQYDPVDKGPEDSDTQSPQDRNRRLNDRYRRGGDYYRPTSSSRAQERGRSSRHEPYRRRGNVETRA
ncbi:hypothetical protein PT974_03946 [Cladobotryum mycophilum]|uniref:RING-type E3 ubiquitin transferase n=1 Tax=Cladobotryum mycophilum TaxID=491253 RepID=A0ABR0SUD6_9HYPO